MDLKSDELLCECLTKQEVIKSFIVKYISSTRYAHLNDDGIDLYKMIVGYGNARESLGTARCKEWMIKKLGGKNG